MSYNHQAAGLLLIAAGVIVAGAYLIYEDAGNRAGNVVASPKSAPKKSSSPVSPGKLAAAHPPVVSVPPGADAREGRVDVDAARPYTHFRVGNKSVTAIYADGSTVWLGTSGGLVRFDTATREFKTYDARDGLFEKGILYLGKLQGKIAAGTYGGGLSVLSQGADKWDHYNISEGLANAFVYDVLEASSGDVWIATGSGVNRVRGGALKERAKWALYSVKNTGGGLPHDRVYRIAEGKDGSIWVATRGGLAKFRNGKWTNWTNARGLGAPNNEIARGPANTGSTGTLSRDTEKLRDTQGADPRAAFNPNHVAALEVGKDGKVWAGTRGAGLARFDGKAWRNYTVKEGLPSDYISTLNFDANGRLWIGTKNGLAHFKDGKFQVMTMAQGLLTESVLSVTTAVDGGLWVGSFGGAAHIRRFGLD